MDELWDKLDDGRSRIKPLVNFTQLLREEDFGDKWNKKSREQFPHLPYQDEGQGPNCNWVVRDDEHVYFFSRIIGTGKDHCDFPKNQSRPTRLQPDRRWPLPTNVRLFQMRERKFQRHQKISLKGRTIWFNHYGQFFSFNSQYLTRIHLLGQQWKVAWSLRLRECFLRCCKANLAKFPR